MKHVLPLLFCTAGAIFFGGCNPTTTPPGPSGLTERPANNECVAFARQTTGGSTEASALAINLNAPVSGLYQAPGDSSRWFATTTSGRIAVFANTPDVTSYSTVSGVPSVNNDGEGGLLSMAFHPQFASNRYVFLSYTATDSFGEMVSRISRYTLGTNNSLSGGVNFIELSQPAANHNGGNIAFGPDGFLYIGFGDGGGAEDTFNNGQNPATFHSKILRINVDQADATAGTPYSIPASNPTSTAPGYKREIFAQGFRNPWKWSFDRMTGELWVADVGQYAWEEVNRVQAGRNYGWPITEGKHCFNTTSCNTAGLTAPVFEYDHNAGCSITGGFVYRGSAIPALQGKYVYGDFCAQGVYSTTLNGSSQREQLTPAPGIITTFGEASDGEIMLGDYHGAIYRLTASNSAPAAEAPATLSEHPCYADTVSKQLSPGVIPYSVNSQLWSDGADKTRYVALPDGKKISLNTKGDMLFPIGSVLVKEFYHQQQIVETRFMMRHDTGWAGYSYEWNADGTDATLSTQAHTKVIDDSYTHIFPSPTQCFQCHTTAANIALGLETAQLNRLHHYDSTNLDANQLDTWQHIGLFTTAITATNRNRYIPPVDDSRASVTERARGYLHSNCSGCHRPGGFPANMDLRYDTSLRLTGLCNVDPVSGDLGISGAKLLVPGNAGQSLLYQRMARTDQHQMPPLARDTVDTEALAVVRTWIEGTGSCSP